MSNNVETSSLSPPKRPNISRCDADYYKRTRPNPKIPYSYKVFGEISLIQHGGLVLLYQHETIPKTGVLLCLTDNEKVFVQGKLQVKCVAGELCVNQAPIASNVEQKIYSPATHSRTTLEARSSIESQIDSITQFIDVIRCVFPSSSSENIKYATSAIKLDDNQSQKWCAVIAERLDSSICDLLTDSSNFSGLFQTNKEDPLGDKMKFSVNLVSEEKNIPIFCETDDMYRAWEVIKNMANKSDSSCNEPPRVVIGGFKSAGKSSLLRHLTNRLLWETGHSDGRPSCVAVLDCDIGQPEFTPSGFVALTLVHLPLLGPPFTHQLEGKLEPIRQCFVGCITPADNPEYYSSCLEHVYKAYLELDPKPPLLVNMMGWVQGLGLLLLVDQIQIVRPHLILQIEVQNQVRNPPRLSNDVLKTLEGWRYKDLKDVTFTHKLVMVSSPAQRSNFGAPDHRDVTLLAHLLSQFAKLPNCLPPALLPLAPGPAPWIQTRLPHLLPWNQGNLALRQLHPATSPFIPEQLLAVFNASLVALCSLPPEMLNNENPSLPTTLLSDPVCDCLGLGLVRGIDPVNKVLYIITGVPFDRLRSVNVLLKGVLDLPAFIFQDQLGAEDAPYVEHPVNIGIGRKSIPAERSFLKVRRHNSHRGARGGD